MDRCLITLDLTEKRPTFPVNDFMSKRPQTIDYLIRSRVYGHGRGWVFTPRHFQRIGSAAAIESALRRLKQQDVIRKLSRGLYDYPVQHPVLGTVAPSADAIARALVGRDAIRLQPAGAYAVNVLGLSEQVPSRIVFLTDGPARKVKIGKQEIILKRTVPRNMAAAGRKSGTLIEALRYLGKKQVDEQVLSIVRRQIADEDRSLIRKDILHAPAWIADLLRPMTEPPTVS
jgi:hypothetical protein